MVVANFAVDSGWCLFGAPKGLQPASSTSAGSATLYSSDGTTAGATQVAPTGGSVVEVVTYNTGPLFLSAGTKSYFLADATASGQQVWVTDGTAAGTHQVTNIADTSGASPALLGLIGTNLIFADYASDNTMQLYLADGTTAGTSTLSNFASTPPACRSSPSRRTAACR